MNVAHLHLLLNHFPTIGFGVALALYFVALAGRSDDLKKASLVMFFAMSLIVMPVYMSGNAAEEVIRDSPDVSKALMERHEDAALLAFVFMQFTGLGAWIELWQFRRSKRPGRLNLLTVLLLGIVTFGLMARAASLGGEIRHPEIRAAQGAEEEIDVTATWNESIAAVVNLNPWVWPTMETLHFLGLGVLFGVVLIVNLRMLGMMKKVPFSALHSLLPVGVSAFAVNLVTGMLFFVATPGQYTQNVAFYGKVVLMIGAAANILYLTMFDEVWTLGPEDEAPWTAKVIAGSGILLWLGVIFCGRMLPFIGNSF
jgi:uncharacterized membrane protein